MKIIRILIIVLSIFCINTLTFSKENNSSKLILPIESSNLECDFGKVAKDSIVKKEIIFVNKLDEDLDVVDIRSTCNCISINVKPAVIHRNGILEAEITIDSAGFAISQEEVLYIITKNSKYELIRLAVMVEIGNL